MNNIYIKYSGVCLLTAIFSLGANQANSQATCITAPDCAAMGYTKTSADCPDGSIKCPWDTSKIFCSELSEPDKTCELGDILYQDKKCYEIGKTKKAPIGIVVSPESTLAMALDVAEQIPWAVGSDANTGGMTDNPYIQNCQQANVPDCIGTGKQLTAAILKFGKEKGYSFPAAEYCNSYATVGTEPGEWFLPSMNEYFFVVYALRYYNIINNSLISIKRPAMGEYDAYWTSSESKANGAWLALGPAKWGLESATHWMEHGKYETEVYVRPMINYGAGN